MSDSLTFCHSDEASGDAGEIRPRMGRYLEPQGKARCIAFCPPNGEVGSESHPKPAHWPRVVLATDPSTT
jgi:hypothetical protein